jgi:hypothetical protein
VKFVIQLFLVNFYRYGLIILTLAIIAGCSDITQPTIEERLQINSITKWKVDTLTNAKINMIYHKIFDIKGNVISQDDFSDEGKKISKSEFSYETNKSIEVKSSFNVEGGVKEKSKTEYEYDINRRVVKQVSYDTNGTVKDVFVFDYDSRGNLTKKVQTIGKTEVNNDININYEYSQAGELLERITKYNSGDLSRDSIAYNRPQKTISIYKFDSKGIFVNSIVYVYNSFGSITNESTFNSSNRIVAKYIYEYSYFSK